MKNNLKISFLVNSYNEQTFLDILIDSLAGINQKFSYDIHIACDLLTNKHYKIEPQLADRITLHHFKKTQRGHNRNQLSKVASGDYFFFLDSSTTISAEKLNELIELIDQRKPHLVQCSILPSGKQDHFFVRYKLRNLGLNKTKNANPLLREQGILSLDTAALIVSRDFFRRLGGFKDGLNRFEDRELLYRIAKQKLKIAAVEKPIFFKPYDRKNFLRLWVETSQDFFFRYAYTIFHFPKAAFSFFKGELSSWSAMFPLILKEQDKTLKKFILSLQFTKMILLLIFIPISLLTALFPSGEKSRKLTIENMSSGDLLEKNIF